jgi:hypothetical protein
MIATNKQAILKKKKRKKKSWYDFCVFQDPSFHVSVAWCVGDVVSQIPAKTRHKIEVSILQ